jgi:drug/metabolite transporter (DMT)-like permease
LTPRGPGSERTSARIAAGSVQLAPAEMVAARSGGTVRRADSGLRRAIMNLIYILVTLFAAMLCGFGFVLQQHAAEQVRASRFLRLGLISRLIHNRRWLLGVAALIAGDLISAWTLGHLDLSVSEPLLTTSLIFALLLAVPLSGQALRRTEIGGAILLCTGVATLSATRSVRAASDSFGSFSHWPAAAAIAIVAALLLQLGLRRAGGGRATLTGAASGLVLGIADALTRQSVRILDGHHPLSLLTSWPGYATIGASLVGLWLMQNAFSAAPLHLSLPAITAAEPAAGMVLGVLVFGDVVHITPLLLAVQAAAIVAMVAGVILVARAPVFADLDLRQLPQIAREHLQLPPHARLLHVHVLARWRPALASGTAAGAADPAAPADQPE